MKNYIKLTDKDIQSFSNEKLRDILDKHECIVKVYSDNCIHCTNMMPQWNKFLERMETKPKVYIIDIEADYFSNMEHSDVKDEVMGFPTIMHVRKNKTNVYNGERDSLKMYNWSMSKIKNSLDIHRSKLEKNKKRKTKNKKTKGKNKNKSKTKATKKNKRQKKKKVRFSV